MQCRRFFVGIDGLCRIISVTINDHYKNTDSKILAIGVLIFSYC